MQKMFHVVVRRFASMSVASPDFEQDVYAQSAVNAAASGLSRIGGGVADCIEVVALQPVPGRPAQTVFQQCSQGVYGFVFQTCVPCCGSQGR